MDGGIQNDLLGRGGGGQGKVVMNEGLPQLALERLVALLDSFTDDDRAGRLEKEGEIHSQIDVLDVDQVIAKAAAEGDAIAAVDLGHAGDAGTHGAALPAVVGRERGHLGRNPGTGAHKSHVTLQDVDELGKFVQGGAAEEAPQREQPLLIGQELPVFILPVVHRFEFDDLEQSSPVPYARLKKKRGFPCRKYKKYRIGQQQRNEDDESYSGKEASKKRFADMYVHKRRGRVTGLQILSK